MYTYDYVRVVPRCGFVSFLDNPRNGSDLMFYLVVLHLVVQRLYDRQRPLNGRVVLVLRSRLTWNRS